MACRRGGRGFQRLALFFELIDLLARAPEKKILASPDYAPTLDKETLRVVHDVISYIVDNLSATVRMSEAAAIAGMTQSAFSRFFKKNTGANFVDYSRKLRIGRACKLLSDTGRPVTDICFEVGVRQYLQLQPPFPQGTRRDALTIQAALESARDTVFASRLSSGLEQNFGRRRASARSVRPP